VLINAVRISKTVDFLTTEIDANSRIIILRGTVIRRQALRRVVALGVYAARSHVTVRCDLTVAICRAADIFALVASAETGFLRPAAVRVRSAIDTRAVVRDANAFSVLAALDRIARSRTNAFRLEALVDSFVAKFSLAAVKVRRALVVFAFVALALVAKPGAFGEKVFARDAKSPHPIIIF
jgi:hypothetical protein